MRSNQDDTRRILRELGRAIRNLTRRSGSLDDGSSMTATQRLALFEVTDAGPLRLNDLAHRLGVSAPTASRAVDALVDLGYVERSVDEADRRALQIEATAAGRDRFTLGQDRAFTAFGPGTAVLTKDERNQLVALLAKVNDELDRPV